MIELFGPGDLRLTISPEIISVIGRGNRHWRDSPRALLCGPGLSAVIVWGDPDELAKRLGGDWLKCERGDMPVLVRSGSILWARETPVGSQIYIGGAGKMMVRLPYGDIAERLLQRPPSSPPPDMDAKR
jgi:hypothetical protein